LNRNDSESRLIRAAQKGDREAFSQLYRTYSSRVYTLALRMSGNSFSAEDLTQDVFIRIWDKIGSFKGKSAFSTWLFRLSMNLLIRKTRTENIHKKKNLPLIDEMSQGTPDLPIEEKWDLNRAIAGLPARCRGVLVLHELMGIGHSEIGRIMGISEGTSKAHLFKAKKILKKELSL
jgi:RNA polymerase sigma-70 factor (ECF subfamily)